MSVDIDSDDLDLDTHPDVESARRRLRAQSSHHRQHRPPRRRYNAELNERLREHGGRLDEYGYVWDAEPESDLVIEEFPESDEFSEE